MSAVLQFNQKLQTETCYKCGIVSGSVAGRCKMSDHVILTPKDCGCIKDSDYNCPICDGGLAVCAVCGKAEIELDQPCILREQPELKQRPWYFTMQELWDAVEPYASCTTDQKDNEEVRATVRAFLSWMLNGIAKIITARGKVQ